MAGRRLCLGMFFMWSQLAQLSRSAPTPGLRGQLVPNSDHRLPRRSPDDTMRFAALGTNAAPLGLDGEPLEKAHEQDPVGRKVYRGLTYGVPHQDPKRVASIPRSQSTTPGVSAQNLELTKPTGDGKNDGTKPWVQGQEHTTIDGVHKPKVTPDESVTRTTGEKTNALMPWPCCADGTGPCCPGDQGTAVQPPVNPNFPPPPKPRPGAAFGVGQAQAAMTAKQAKIDADAKFKRESEEANKEDILKEDPEHQAQVASDQRKADKNKAARARADAISGAR